MLRPPQLSVRSVLLALCLVGGADAALAADIAAYSPLGAGAEVSVGMAPEWRFRFVPYGWLTSMKGTQTVRGRTSEVDASFTDIVEKSDTLVGLMGTFEARNGPLALYGDLVWSKVGLDGGTVRTRTGASGLTGTVERSLGLDIEMAIVEVGAAYEVASTGPLSLDILGGARYWHQDADVSFESTRTIGFGNVGISGGRSLSVSGSVDWLDPVVGARMRYSFAPGQELSLRGDIGGFGAGSDFSWQAIGAYGFDLGTWNGVTPSSVIGYRALSVDYAEGGGDNRYEFDMVQHGPIVGVSMRW